jgi:hypothetical protein
MWKCKTVYLQASGFDFQLKSLQKGTELDITSLQIKKLCYIEATNHIFGAGDIRILTQADVLLLLISAIFCYYS